jgi:hemoglobin
MTASLYERLGESEGIQRIANDLVNNHVNNQLVGKRFADSDLPVIKKVAAEFFITGSGGPGVYKGEDMIATHKGMNISGGEFLAVLDDAMGALEKNDVGQREKEEVLFILFSMRNEVMTQ